MNNELHPNPPVSTPGHHEHEIPHSMEEEKSSFVEPKTLLTVSGKITNILFNAHSDVDGLLLDNEHQVHFPPHNWVELCKSVKIGQKVIAQGIKSKTVDLLFANSITLENGTILKIEQPQKKK